MAEQKFSAYCGFFDSINDDRLYSAEEMNRPYKRVISNGVFATPNGTPSTDLQVLQNSDMNITVKKGEGLFADKWFENPSDLVITVTSNSDIVPRIDSILVQVDKSQNGRAGFIIYREGSPSSNPQPPAINTDENMIEYRLANIRVNQNVSRITQSDITDMRGSAECLWVTSLIKQVDTSELFKQWQSAYQEYYDGVTGDFDQYMQTEKEAFDTFMKNLTQDLTVNTNLVKYESHYTTVSDNTETVPINIPTYNKDKDLLLVRINKLFASEGVDYTIDDNSQITLTKDIKSGQKIDFISIQSVIVGDTETLLQQVQKIANALSKSVIISDTGGTKLSITDTNSNILDSFMQLDQGFYTIYTATGVKGTPQDGSYRMIGHKTDAADGWLMSFQDDGSVYVNYNSDGNWLGWKSIFEKIPTVLYYSETGSFPDNDVEITPSKPLDQCQHGWELIFTGYDDNEQTPKDEYVQITHIPKYSYKKANWDGESTIFSLVYECDISGSTIKSCIKSFKVYNDRIVSTSFNNQGNSKNMVLRAIYEY